MTKSIAKVKNDLLTLKFDNEKKAPYVMYQGIKYTSLITLLCFEELKSNAAIAAKVINHFAKGFQFEVILKPSDFTQRYLKKIQSEENIKSAETPKTSSFGIYQVDSISEPSFQNNYFIFYAENTENGVPYKVTFPFSQEASKPKCTYTLLELKSE